MAVVAAEEAAAASTVGKTATCLVTVTSPESQAVVVAAAVAAAASTADRTDTCQETVTNPRSPENLAVAAAVAVPASTAARRVTCLATATSLASLVTRPGSRALARAAGAPSELSRHAV